MTDLFSRLRALDREVVASPFPDDAREQREHLVDQVALFSAWEVLHADPSQPFFHRHNDLVSQWGGPNADNVYRHARIEPGRRYRITGKMHSCDRFICALRAGFMHQDVWGTKATIESSDLGLGPGDEIDFVIGGDDQPIPEGVVMASIREYYFEWRASEPAVFTIECLDPEPAPAAPDLDDLLDRAADQVETSVRNWNAYLIEHRARRTDNSFAEDQTVAKGLSQARYAFCFWYLGPDEALVVECDRPAADYWALQLYRLGTFELVDPYGCVSSRNQTQSVVDDDGRVRWVLAASDPGVANWLDTNGRAEGLCTLRWFWPTRDQSPAPTAQVVGVDEVREVLPAGTARVSAAERAAELAARQAHLRWRFRS